MRVIIRVGCQVPFQYITAPVTGSTYNEVSNVPFQIPAKIATLEGGLLSKIDVLARKSIMNRPKSINITSIKVKC